MHIVVDLDKCVGAGMCVRTVPTVFAQRDVDGLSELLDPDPPAELEGAVRDAAYRLCPAKAIIVDSVARRR